jgi:hypothetical protein
VVGLSASIGGCDFCICPCLFAVPSVASVVKFAFHSCQFAPIRGRFYLRSSAFICGCDFCICPCLFAVPSVASVVKSAFHSCQFAVQFASIRGWFSSAFICALGETSAPRIRNRRFYIPAFSLSWGGWRRFPERHPLIFLIRFFAFFAIFCGGYFSFRFAFASLRLCVRFFSFRESLLPTTTDFRTYE